ncbi:MAG: MmgE/PrpD family protein [Rhodospirillales bacterium]|nr:MmgE/PrpD family protein [Rhodospirillales bacterium]
MTLTRTLAKFTTGLTHRSMPAEVVEKARVCLLNGYGIGLGSHGTPYAPVARRAAIAMDGGRPGDATLLCDGRKASVPGAALANSALFHGRAQEDTCGAAHLGAIMIPLLTALAEARDYPMSRFIPALVAGYEAGGLLEAAYAGRTTPAGLRASPIYGTIAAAAAASRLMELDEERTAAAIANAASFSGGILQSFADGTDEWRYQVGVAARNGLVAAELARAGSVSAPHAIEGSAGFVKAFARTDCDVGALEARLGKEWSIARVTFKPYPVCAFNQTPVICALALRDQIGGRRIASIRVSMNPYETGYAGMDSTGPFNSISGTLMSIPFCIAATLARGVPTMRMMTTYDDAEVNALVGRVQLVSDASIPTLCCRIEVELESGERIERYEKKVPADYSFSRSEVSELVRRIGGEIGIPASAYDRLERFVDALPDARIADVIASFAEAPALRDAA